MKKKYKLLVVVSLIVLCISVFVISLFISDSTDINEDAEIVSKFFIEDAVDADDDFYSLQTKGDEKIETAVNEKVSLDEAIIIVDPYEVSPLSAVIVFVTENAESVTLEVSGELYEFESSTTHIIPVYGLIAGEVNTVIVSVGAVEKSFELDMSEVDIEIDIEVLVNEGSLSDGVYLFTNPNEDGVYAIDSDGQLVWYLDASYFLTPTLLENGHLLLSSEEVNNNSQKKGVIEIDFLGKIYNYYEIESGLHHDYELLDNGNLIVASNNLYSETSNDYIIEMDLSTGQIVKEIDLNEIFSLIDDSVIDAEDWFFINGLYYDENTNSLIITGRLQNAVISIDYDTLSLNWIFGDPSYWSDAYSEYMIFYDGVYPLGSHTASINSDGNLMLFNNNYDKANQLIVSEYVDYRSSGEIYNIDYDSMSAQLVSKFDDNESFFSYAVSSYTKLSNGNYLLMSGWHLSESDFETDVYLNNNIKGSSSTIYELDDEFNILFKASTSVAIYSGIKANLYQGYNYNLSTENLSYYVNYEKYTATVVDIEDIVDKLSDTENFPYYYSVTDNTFNISTSDINSTDYLNIYFINKDGKVLMYSLKQADGVLSNSIDIFEVSGECVMFFELNGEFYNFDTNYIFE